MNIKLSHSVIHDYKKKCVHCTSVHSRTDTRIFLKECRSLMNAGYSVSLIVADGQGDELSHGVKIFDVGSSANRLHRMFKVTDLILCRAKEIDANVFHLHDPELLPIGLKLKRLGKKVLFDAHEDVPKQLLDKPYLNRPLRWLLSRIFAAYEERACERLDGVISATPHIHNKFLNFNTKTININNFPFVDELAVDQINWHMKKKQIAYVGGIARIRGIVELVQSLPLVKSEVRLMLAGRFASDGSEKDVCTEEGWSKVDHLGFLDRKGVKQVLQESFAGLVTFHPLSNHIDAQPNKMFEYMSAGIPVIASNFPLWREIIVGNNCGICVDPLNPAEIAAAIEFLSNNPLEAKKMGANGQLAVFERYNWAVEEKKLIEFYSRLDD